MMCWESIDDSEQASKKQKMHAQDNETNDSDNEMDVKTPTVPKHTTNMVKHLNIPVGELRLGADDDVSMLATQETSAKNLVYIMNMLEGTLETAKNARHSSKNRSEQDDKKPSPLEKTNQVISHNQLNAYGESDRDDNPKRAIEHRKNTWRTRKIVHMEFESDDDVDKQAKNSSYAKAEGKVRVRKRLYTIMRLAVTKRKESTPTRKKLGKPKMATKINKRMMKIIRLLCQTK